MFRFVLFSSVAALVAIGATPPAEAQMVCGDRGKMTGHLDKNYQESRSGLGLSTNGAVLELFTANTGTWTILLTRPGGPTCVLGSGEGWELQQMPVPAKGELS